MVNQGGQPERVLVVEDDPSMRRVLVELLRRDGLAVEAVATGAETSAALDRVDPAVVILDLGLPDMSGYEVLRQIRTDREIPVVVLSGRADETDRVLALELGADDYVVKPFSPRELAARVNGVLRRAAPKVATDAARLDFGPLVVDQRAREVTLDGELVDFTPKEFDVLAHLAASPREVFSRADLLRDVWQSSPDWQDPATVTVHVRRIRNKIETDPENPRWITTVWGVGYRFEP